MANSEHLKILIQGVRGWNRWVQENPEIETDLSSAQLNNTDLSNAYLNNADLSGAYLNNADLSGAYLNNADLSEAQLRGRTSTRRAS